MTNSERILALENEVSRLSERAKFSRREVARLRRAISQVDKDRSDDLRRQIERLERGSDRRNDRRLAIWVAIVGLVAALIGVLGQPAMEAAWRRLRR